MHTHLNDGFIHSILSLYVLEVLVIHLVHAWDHLHHVAKCTHLVDRLVLLQEVIEVELGTKHALHHACCLFLCNGILCFLNLQTKSIMNHDVTVHEERCDMTSPRHGQSCKLV